MKIIILAISLLLLSSCTLQNETNMKAITVNEDQLISTSGSHPDKIDSLYFQLRKQQRVTLGVLEKLVKVEKIMYEKKILVENKERGIIIAGSGKNNSTYLVLMLTTTEGSPLAYKEFSKNGQLSAIYEVSDDNNLEMTWYTGSGNTLKKHSFDSFKITADSIQ